MEPPFALITLHIVSEILSYQFGDCVNCDGVTKRKEKLALIIK